MLTDFSPCHVFKRTSYIWLSLAGTSSQNPLGQYTVFLLTLSLPREPEIKIQDESQISFCKILKYKYSESKRVKKLYPIQQHFLGHNSETLIHFLQRFTPPYHSSCFWSAEDKVRIMTWILLSGQTRELQSGVAL